MRCLSGWQVGWGRIVLLQALRRFGGCDGMDCHMMYQHAFERSFELPVSRCAHRRLEAGIRVKGSG